MKRSVFLIAAIGGGVKLMQGYEEYFQMCNGGRVLTICYDKRGSMWYATEKSTGLGAGHAESRKKCSEFVNSVFPRLLTSFETDRMVKAAEYMQQAYKDYGLRY